VRHRARHRHHRGPLQAIALNMLAVGWLARGMWRVSHGRLPWQGRRAG
jgi:hypothetical protein